MNEWCQYRVVTNIIQPATAFILKRPHNIIEIIIIDVTKKKTFLELEKSTKSIKLIIMFDRTCHLQLFSYKKKPKQTQFMKFINKTKY